MKNYAVTVRRMQVWHLEVEAADEEEAEKTADELTCVSALDDEYAYSTEAKEIP